MKFLCVPCDVPMRLIETRPPDRGSVTLVYSCPDCAYEFAMLTNAYETQIVSSMGVKVGPGEQPATEAAGASRCPFSGMVREMTTAAPGKHEGLVWTAEASRRLETVPEFVRPMAKTGIERYAREKGYAEIDPGVLDEAREFFGM